LLTSKDTSSAEHPHRTKYRTVELSTRGGKARADRLDALSPAFSRRTLLLELYGEERVVRERDLNGVPQLCEKVLQAL
jgi:hypothetical protein